MRLLSYLMLPAPALLLIAPAGARAQDEPALFELTPYAAYRFGGSFDEEESSTSIDLDESGGFGLIFNRRQSANTQWEVIYSRQDTVADTATLTGFGPSTKLSLEYLQGGGTYEFDTEHNVRPYLAATLGGLHVSPRVPDLDSDTFWSMSIGLGLQVRPDKRVGIRLEGRVWGTLVDSDTSLFCVSSGGAACAIRIDGTVLWQFEGFAGLTVRF